MENFRTRSNYFTDKRRIKAPLREYHYLTDILITVANNYPIKENK